MTDIHPDEVFQNIERDRQACRLSSGVTNANPIYEASIHHIGMIDQVWSNGTRFTGKFCDGRFGKIVQDE